MHLHGLLKYTTLIRSTREGSNDSLDNLYPVK